MQGNARLTGFEFSAEYHPTPYLHLSGTADYTRGQNRSADQPLPLVPPFRATYSAQFEGKGNGFFLSPYVSVGGETDAHQTELDPNDFSPRATRWPTRARASRWRPAPRWSIST